MPNQVTQAAAVVVTTLKSTNRLDHTELRDALTRRRLPSEILPDAVRLIRDAYGDDALVGVWHHGRYLYVWDPPEAAAVEWMKRQTHRALVEMGHVNNVLDFVAKKFGNRGAVRSARRYSKNLIAEFDEIIEMLDLL